MSETGAPRDKIRLAFPLLGRGGWTGGFVYLKNTLRLINGRLADRIEPWVFLSPEENDRFGKELSPLVDDRVLVDPAIAVSGRGKSLARALLTGQDEALGRLLVERRIDAAFENASFYGARFPVPVVSWMPDFQHRHMPEMFTRGNWWRRDIGFRMQARAKRALMVSSETARADLERYYPAARGRAHVVRFAIDLDVTPYLARGADVRALYKLPQRYFFLPNQFWRHKNHRVIVEALARLKAEGRLDALPPVILTGQPKDPRSPTHFDDLMTAAKAAGVEQHFRYLGLIPYDDVLALNASCLAMINPSRFEGWSTPIEEAKAFATPLILADIPIHREQAPDATFFPWERADAAAEALTAVAARGDGARPSATALMQAQGQRLDEHARALLAVVSAAAASRTKVAA
jgi:glycosyltransferase involved in cell wall biosynthesis